jgi:MurNAc alpha-1-phosphate uridylyltransferase
MTVPLTTAMVLAAGLGTRMRPLTDDRPKALVEVDGRALVDHMLERLAEGGVTRAVVNLHAFADRLEAHLRARTGAPDLAFSDERAQPLETGGGIRHARALLGDDPILVANIDSVWIETGRAAIADLRASFDPGRMDALLLLTPAGTAMGFDGPGDFVMDTEGRLTPRRVAGTATAPFAYIGVHATRPDAIYAHPPGKFSLMPEIWGAMAAAGRLHGRVLEGQWMHVGDPAARDAAEARLRS